LKNKINVIQYGCGPIGCSVAKLALQKSYLTLIGAVDTAKDKVGKDLGELAGQNRKIGVSISNDLGAVAGLNSADVVLHCTSSQLIRVVDQLQQIVEAGCDVISTCEELSFPYKKHPELSNRINRIALEHNVTVLATGINPGFLMDAWPLFMSGVCQKVDLVKVARVQDASLRRLPFQKKIGAGCSVREFQALVDGGRIRHVGIEESIGMIAGGMGWQLDEVTEKIDPVIAEAKASSQYLTVEPGQVAGVRQMGYGSVEGKIQIILEFVAYLGARETYDEVCLYGIPDLRATVHGGINGDIGTAATVVNSIPRVVHAKPGLLTVKDLPMAVCSS
jgi:hypothetical protein